MLVTLKYGVPLEEILIFISCKVTLAELSYPYEDYKHKCRTVNNILPLAYRFQLNDTIFLHNILYSHSPLNFPPVTNKIRIFNYSDYLTYILFDDIIIYII